MEENKELENQTTEQTDEQPAEFNKWGLISLICAILGIVFPFVKFIQWGALVPAIVGIVFGVKGKRFAEENESGAGLAKTGFVLSIIATVIAALSLLCLGAITLIWLKTQG